MSDADTPDRFRRRLEEDYKDKIPERTRRSLYLYYAHRCKPGSGLCAILAKEFEAIVMVDDEVYAAMRAIYGLLHNYARPGLWGTRKRVDMWIAGIEPWPDDWLDPEDAVSRLGEVSADAG